MTFRTNFLEESSFTFVDWMKDVLHIAQETSKVDDAEVFFILNELNSILKQIVLYSEAGYFESREDVFILCDKLHELVDHQQRQAELDFKFPNNGNQPVGVEGNFQLFHNDIILADNTILVKAGDTRATYLTNNAINLIVSYDREYFEYNYAWGRNLLSKSVPISGTAEKERNRFFRILHEKIDAVKSKL